MPLFWRVSERFGSKIWGAPNADPTTTDPTPLFPALWINPETYGEPWLRIQGIFWVDGQEFSEFLGNSRIDGRTTKDVLDRWQKGNHGFMTSSCMDSVDWWVCMAGNHGFERNGLRLGWCRQYLPLATSNSSDFGSLLLPNSPTRVIVYLLKVVKSLPSLLLEWPTKNIKPTFRV